MPFPLCRSLPLAVLLAAAAPAPLRAQQESPPVLKPQPQQPSLSAAESPEVINGIQFPNAPVKDVLDFYERLTGKKAIYDNTVQGQVNIVVKTPVTRDEAIRLVEAALLVNGFTLVPGPGDIVKVLGLTKNARQFAVPILSDVRDIPESDQVISFLFKLDYADPVEVQQIVSQYVAPSPYTSFLPLPKSQALIATESSNVIRTLARLIAAIDKPPAEVVSEFIPLERANAQDVVDKLTAIFEKQPTPGLPVPPGAPSPQRGPNQETTTIQGAAGATATLSEDSLIIGKVRLTADVRTNRIHVVTRPINLPFIRRLIAEYDSNLAFGEPARRVLRYVSAADVLDIIVSTLEERSKEDQSPAAAQARAARQGQQASTTRAATGGTGSTGGTGGTGGSASLRQEELATPEIDTTPEARTVGNTKIIADKRSNAVIVLGSQEAKEKVFRVLDEIDIRAPQVMLTAVIGELTLNDDEEFGVDYIQSLGRETTTTVSGSSNGVTVTRATSGFAGAVRNTAIPITDLGALTTASTLAGVPAGATAFIGVTKSLEVIVHALESTGRFRVTSRPMVFTSNNKKAVIASGQEIAVPGTITSGLDTTINGTLVNNTNVQYKDVVLKLEVVPLINSDNEVTLDIVQEVNNVSGATVIGGNSIPTVSTRRVKTTVSVANEATIVLGGLVQESKENTISKIPLLGDIPVLGKLFSNTRKTTKRTELVVLLRPTVANGNTEAVVAGERAQEKLNIPPDLESTLDPKGYRAEPVPPGKPSKVKVRVTEPPPRPRDAK